MIFPVSISNPYVYLDYLIKTDIATWNEAVSLANSLNGTLNSIDAQEKLQNAILFLFNIAKQQRNNEVAFIQNKLNEYKKNNKLYNDEKLDQLNNKLNAILENAKKGQDFNYIEFTKILNEILMVKNNFKSRLLALKSNLETSGNRKNQGVLVGLDKEFKNLIALLQGKKANIEEFESNEEIISDIIYKYLINNQENLNFKNPSALIAALLKLQTNFRFYLEKNQKFKTFRKNEKINTQYNKFNDLFQKFIQAEKDNDLLSQTPEGQKELTTISKIFNFTTKTDKKVTKAKKESYLTLENFKLPNIQFKDNDYISDVIFFSNITSNAISERISDFINHIGDLSAAVGSYNLGDDALLGQIGAKYNLNDKQLSNDYNALTNALDTITQAEKYFADSRRNTDEYEKNYKQLNTEIENALKILNDDMQDNQSEAFIIHESAKYYETLEKGESSSWNNKTKQLQSGFGGRTLGIFPYINTLCNIGLDLGLDPNTLKFLGINLGPHAAANNSRSTLEQIFSIAASLIMFDDAAIIVKEASGQLEFSNVTSLHLYNLQGMYFPASYIIEQSATYLSGLLSFSSKDAATATIIGPNYNLSKAEYGMPDKWKELKQQAQSTTKVSIHFFLNFANFISNISL